MPRALAQIFFLVILFALAFEYRGFSHESFTAFGAVLLAGVSPQS